MAGFGILHLFLDVCCYVKYSIVLLGTLLSCFRDSQPHCVNFIEFFTKIALFLAIQVVLLLKNVVDVCTLHL